MDPPLYQKWHLALLVWTLDWLFMVAIVVCLEKAYHHDPWKIMAKNDMNTDAVYFVMTCAGALIGITFLSALTQFWSICSRRRWCLCRFYIVKFLIFVLVTTAIYIIPKYCIEDYTLKLDKLVEENVWIFILFEILKPHPALPVVLVYQLISFLIFHFFTNGLRKADNSQERPSSNDVEMAHILRPLPETPAADSGEVSREDSRSASPPPSPEPPLWAHRSQRVSLRLIDEQSTNNRLKGPRRRRRFSPAKTRSKWPSLYTIPEAEVPSQEANAPMKRSQTVIGFTDLQTEERRVLINKT